MRIFLAGATGAIGRELVPLLVAAGHAVTGATRTPAKAQWLTAAGARPVVVDAMDTGALRRAVLDAAPEVVIDELTDLPASLPSVRPMRHFYDRQIPLKATACPALVAAAQEAGARLHLMQSIAFLYEPGPGALRDEDDPPFRNAPPPASGAVRPFEVAERAVTAFGNGVGVVLRYGLLYGPGTHFAVDGAIADLVRRRRYPVIGNGAGVTSFLHVRDAALATLAAVDAAQPGVFNIVDDDPAPVREWVPEYARVLGAPPPRVVPAWLARAVAGRLVVHMATTMSGASNARARRQLGWRPSLPSWREGFRTALG